MIAPLAKTGAISPELNLWLAVPIGFVFGFALFHAGFTDGRRIAWAFYFKDVGVPVVMFSAIVTGMLGLWGLRLVGFLGGSLIFGDLFPVWGDFYNSDYMGVVRLDQTLGVGLGAVVFGIMVIAVAGSLGMRWIQHRFWPTTEPADPQKQKVLKLQGSLIGAALLIGLLFAFFPTESFIDDTVETPYYIIPKAEGTQ